jgi:hypothetical protein
LRLRCLTLHAAILGRNVARFLPGPRASVSSPNHPGLQDARRGLVGRQALAFGCRAGYLLQPPDQVFLADRQGDEQDADEIARL